MTAPHPHATTRQASWDRFEHAHRVALERGEGGLFLALGFALANKREERLAELWRRVCHAESTGAFVAARTATTLLVWLPGRGADDARTLVRAWGREADGAAEPGLLRPVVGVAEAPPSSPPSLDVARRLPTLVRVAEEGLRVAGYRGSGHVVHTMLYTQFAKSELAEEELQAGAGPAAAAPAGATAPAAAPDGEPFALVGASGSRIPATWVAPFEVAHRFLTDLPDPEEAARSRERIDEVLGALGRAPTPDANAGALRATDGLASGFRAEQALSGEERDYENRLAFLRWIAAQNLTLRAALEAVPPSGRWGTRAS